MPPANSGLFGPLPARLRVLGSDRIQWRSMSRPHQHSEESHEGPPAVTEAEVVAHLSRSRKPQSLREIAAALGLRHSGRRALVKLARKMKKRGDIHEYPNGRVGLPKEKQGARYAQPPQKKLQGRHGAGPEPRSDLRSELR